MNAKYVIVTPGYNEEKYIGFPLRTVAEQDLLPLRWFLVDDGSTDGTAAKIREAAASADFIRYRFRAKSGDEEYFASNVKAIEEGVAAAYSALSGEGGSAGFDYIAILDADISLPPGYYRTIISRMEANPRIGIASGIYENLIDGNLVPVLNDRRSTPKAVMVFRRACYEDIGGLLPLGTGGEDTAACVTARMKGWVAWSYPDVKVVHHRPTGLGNAGGILRARYRMGISEYGLGSHPLFAAIKSVKRAFAEKPYLIGGFLRFLGYVMGYITVRSRIVSKEFIRFYRNEQLNRIFRFNRIQDPPALENEGT